MRNSINLTLLVVAFHSFGQNQVSPDGQVLVSYERREDGSEIYIQRFGGRKEFLTDDKFHNYNPQWSADGKSIIFYKKVADKDLSKIVLYEVSNKRESVILESGYYDGDPTLSKDQKHVAFTSNRDGNFDIYLLDLSSHVTSTLLSNDADNWGPTWSPNSQRLAFTSNMKGNFEIFSIGRDGIGLVQLTTIGGENYKPDWSPDGRWIAFFHRDNAEEKFDIFIVSNDGRQIQNVTKSPERNEFTCGWVGDQLYFYSDKGIQVYNLLSEEIKTVQLD